MQSYRRKEEGVVFRRGKFFHRLSLWQAVTLIVSGTIGAGILALPYTVAQVGMGIGLLYLVGVGLLMMGMNLLLGEIVVRTNSPLHLPGLAEKYLGKAGRIVMSIVMYGLLGGALVVYIIGEGETLSALFGGSATFWSILFAIIGSTLIVLGTRTVKTVELFFVMALLVIILFLVFFSVPVLEIQHLQYVNFANVFLPYGIILFAFHGVTAVPEAHALLVNRNNVFRRAILISSAIVMLIYILFTVMVVGITGQGTTEIATIGLGQQLGPTIFLLGNIFALLTMGTSFLMIGVALRDSLSWDFRLSPLTTSLVVCGIPFLIFIFGIRGFTATLDTVGGVFGSLELLAIIAIYWRARSLGDLQPKNFGLHHAYVLAVILLLALFLGTLYSTLKLF